VLGLETPDDGDAQGLYYSSDKGANWVLKLNKQTHQIVKDPITKNTLYAALEKTGVYKSTEFCLLVLSSFLSDVS
jgi:hypothetical protein